ncbi:Putative pectinesterase/pectinesterase inhibitor 22 [Linum grandiflorum]
MSQHQPSKLPFFPPPTSSIPVVVQPTYVVRNFSAESWMQRACTGIRDPETCVASLRGRASLRQRSPASIVNAAIRTTLKEARSAIDAITKFTALSFSYREQLAVEDCKELLDFSVTELAWSLAEMNRVRTGETGSQTGLPNSEEGNLKAWLSAALGNQDTCLEGFEGTDRHVEKFIRGSLKQVTQLIGNVLALYTELHGLPFRKPVSPRYSSPEFPDWMTESDRKAVKGNPVDLRIDAVVALDGTGHFRSIADAVDRAPPHNNSRYVIFVKKGIYHENIDMKKKKTNVMLVGEGIGKTVVTGNRNFMQGWTTFRTATVAVSGKGFIARDMTFRNTAGPENHQAVALRVDSDQSAFYRCSMEGYQDTLYAHSLRQFYRECEIYGTIDYIFGNGAAVFQNCRIYTRVPLPQQKVTITAQGRKNPHQSTGFSIQDSFLYATQPCYLGRPWKEYSRTVYMNTYMSGLVQPRGWLEWYGNFGLGTLWYGEYRNYGPGGAVSGRVKWPGYHIIRDAATAKLFTVGEFIDGRSWLPATGVKFTAGLTK